MNIADARSLDRMMAKLAIYLIQEIPFIKTHQITFDFWVMSDCTNNLGDDGAHRLNAFYGTDGIKTLTERGLLCYESFNGRSMTFRLNFTPTFYTENGMKMSSSRCFRFFTDCLQDMELVDYEKLSIYLLQCLHFHHARLYNNANRL